MKADQNLIIQFETRLKIRGKLAEISKDRKGNIHHFETLFASYRRYCKQITVSSCIETNIYIDWH